MTLEQRLILFKEIIWISLSLILVAIVLYPIYALIDYTFLLTHTLCIILSIYYIRLFVIYRESIMNRKKWLKHILFIINIFLFVWVLKEMQYFLYVYQTFTLKPFARKIYAFLDSQKQYDLLIYIKKTFVLSTYTLLFMIVIVNLKILITSIGFKSSQLTRYFKK